MDNGPSIVYDSLNEAVVPTPSLALISVIQGAPEPDVIYSILDFINAQLFPMRKLVPLVKACSCGL